MSNPHVQVGPVVPSASRGTGFVLQTASSPGFGHAGLNKKTKQNKLFKVVPNPLWASQHNQCHQPQGRGCSATLLADRSLPAAGRETDPPQCLLAFRQHGMAGDRTVPDPCQQSHPLNTRKSQIRLRFFLPLCIKCFSSPVS